MKKFLVALPTFQGYVGFNCRTILVSAISKAEAISKAIRLSKADKVGSVKEVNY